MTGEKEKEFRFELQRRLVETHGGTTDVPAALVNDLRIFWGGRGIWYDATRTRSIMPPGITVGVLHTGRHYDDDLSSDSIVYHYPNTDSPGKDRAEVEATKNAGTLEIPIFVVVEAGNKKDVHLAWVIEWNDEAREFLLLFSEEPPASLNLHLDPEDDTEFKPFEMETGNRKTRVTKQRNNQDKFAFAVLKRYGTACSACGIQVSGLIDAAHIIPDAAGGSSDARNGLPLCPTHHRAFDAGILRINAVSLEFCAAPGRTLEELRVTKHGLQSLRAQPHNSALEWRWQHPNGKR